MKQTKKLIEVALPLVAINEARAREKSIRHGHPSSLHLWWARRPLATARAVIFAQMVDDPSAHPDLFPTEKKQEKERQRLFSIIKDLVQWENTNNEEVLERARAEIWQSWRAACAENVDHPHAKELFNRHKLPGFHDPFAGGGTLPLEAQRLGLEACASDLNPVAVLINKATIEIPPKFAGRPPINPQARQQKDLIAREWKGAQGLAEDVRYYGKWMRKEAEMRIGHLYPQIEITADMAKGRPDLKSQVGQKLIVIAWLWARTVKSPNPAFAKVDVPLVSTFMLSTKEGKESYLEPVIEGSTYRFTVRMGTPKDTMAAKNGTKLSRGANFQCLMSRTPIAGDYIKAEGRAGRMGARLLAVVGESAHGRVYLPAVDGMEEVAHSATPAWSPEGSFVEDARAFTPCIYGLREWRHLFTARQLVALSSFSDLVQEARERVRNDGMAASLGSDDRRGLHSEGTGATAYADAVSVYLGLAVSKLADYNSSLVQWSNSRDQAVHVFGRQALAMVWDYAEVNPLGNAAGDLTTSLAGICRTIEATGLSGIGQAVTADARTQTLSNGRCVSTDPPYYDNVPYADLSDYFYVWLRRSLKPVFPDLFATLVAPKEEELVAFAYRHRDKAAAESFFLDGMTQAMRQLAEQAHPAFPVTIYYAFKQAESDGGTGLASTGWETFLDGVTRAGFALDGTWPMRTEKPGRMRENDSNALASSIILVCRRRSANAPVATRRDFITALKSELPLALAHLQHSNIAPVDLAQAAIGPGMAVYTRYDKVLDAEGKPLTVRDALSLINQILDEVLAEQEGDFDADSRWALAWFEQYGFASAEYGVAETLSKAKNTSVTGLVEAGILTSKAGKVRLLKPADLSEDWDPTTDKRLTAWEMVHHLIRVLEADGESAAAALAAKMGSKAEIVRELAYRLYTLCERKKRAPEALAYNGLVQSWPEITRLAREGSKPTPGQTKMFEEK
jgi:putative DNA methylase